ncbi:MAG TPA: NUDIX domain-containing protein [Candidatus Saccharibacteria bacterium]|nr:NUDIX domain-containing protein [Candidatus Saccharibacteria bacterium]HRQ07012.1 NUDIX domain-containing protein [Candidatus Saccharibacteria bacterium]
MTARRINVRGIIYKDGKMLCQQLTPGADGKVRDYWCTPGGGLDAGESLHQGLTREIVEEIGISPKIGKLLFIQQFEGGSRNQEQLEFFFHIENASDYHDIDLSSTTHGMAEIQDVEFIDPKNHNVLPSFLTKIDIAAYINSNLPVLIDNELN